MTSRLLSVLIVTFVIGGALMFAAQPEAKAPPDKIVIDGCKKKKPAVHFNHALHAKKGKIKCVSCHHKGKPGSKCSKCHAGKAKGKKPGCAEMSMKKNPFHINCAGCHKKVKKGPTKCKACHKK
jgi:Class III cytochrome C family